MKLLGRIFQCYKRIPLSIFRIIRNGTKSSEAEGSSFGFFGIVTPYFLNSAEQLFHSQYFIILCLSFFPNFSFGQRVPSRFHRWFRLEKRKFCELKVPFSKRLFRKKIFSKIFACLQFGKMWFPSLMRIIWGNFGHWEIEKTFKNSVLFFFKKLEPVPAC